MKRLSQTTICVNFYYQEWRFVSMMQHPYIFVLWHCLSVTKHNPHPICHNTMNTRKNKWKDAIKQEAHAAKTNFYWLTFEYFEHHHFKLRNSPATMLWDIVIVFPAWWVSNHLIRPSTKRLRDSWHPIYYKCLLEKIDKTIFLVLLGFKKIKKLPALNR